MEQYHQQVKDGRSAYEICAESGLLATEYCPETLTRYYGGSGLPKEQLNLWKTNGQSGGKSSAPSKRCNIHSSATESKQEEKTKPTQDSSRPKIELAGGSTITLNVGESYSEPGFTATDDQDGDITSKVKVSGTVNTSKAGTYTITYSVSDSAGNKGTAKRTVKVVGSSPKPEPENNTTPEPEPEPDNTEP